MNNKAKYLIGIVYILGLHSVAHAQTATTTTAETTSKSSGIFTKEKWGASYFNYMNGPAFSDDSGGSINHYLSLKHKFTKDWSLTATLRPDSNFGNDKESFQMGDSYLKLSYPTIFKGDKVTVTGQVRYYAPLSESSKKAGHNGKVSPRIYVSTSSGKFNYMYILIPSIYLNRSSEDGQRLGGHGHWLSTSYKLSDKYSVDFAVYPGWNYTRGKPVAFNDVPAYPGVSMKVSEKMSLSGYMQVILGNPDSKTTSAGASLSYTML